MCQCWWQGEYSALVKKEDQQRAVHQCTRMEDQHTELSITSDVSSLTNNTEVSNTNSDELKDKADSKFDCEYEVRNCIFCLL
jgi:hypothetical protein